MYTSAVEYYEGSDIFEGFVATHDKEKKKPAVIVAHIWGGLDDFAKNKTILCAKQNYVGFALDVYGKGKRAIAETEFEKCEKLMQPLLNDRQLLRKRLLATLEAVKRLPYVDENNIAIMGYCLGGLCAIDLVRTGTDIKAAISFHGMLDKPSYLSTEKTQAKVLVLHAHEDELATPEHVLTFEKEMTTANIDWQLHIFGHTHHGFTNPKLTTETMNVYKPEATRIGELLMWDLLKQVFV